LLYFLSKVVAEWQEAKLLEKTILAGALAEADSLISAKTYEIHHMPDPDSER